MPLSESHPLPSDISQWEMFPFFTIDEPSARFDALAAASVPAVVQRVGTIDKKTFVDAVNQFIEREPPALMEAYPSDLPRPMYPGSFLHDNGPEGGGWPAAAILEPGTRQWPDMFEHHIAPTMHYLARDIAFRRHIKARFPAPEPDPRQDKTLWKKLIDDEYKAICDYKWSTVCIEPKDREVESEDLYAWVFRPNKSLTTVQQKGAILFVASSPSILDQTVLNELVSPRNINEQCHPTTTASTPVAEIILNKIARCCARKHVRHIILTNGLLYTFGVFTSYSNCSTVKFTQPMPFNSHIVPLVEDYKLRYPNCASYVEKQRLPEPWPVCTFTALMYWLDQGVSDAMIESNNGVPIANGQTTSIAEAVIPQTLPSGDNVSSRLHDIPPPTPSIAPLVNMAPTAQKRKREAAAGDDRGPVHLTSPGGVVSAEGTIVQPNGLSSKLRQGTKEIKVASTTMTQPEGNVAPEPPSTPLSHNHSQDADVASAVKEQIVQRDRKEPEKYAP